MLYPQPLSNVLIVDDEPDVRRELAELVRRGGHAVREASGLRDALSCLRTARYDVVLTDAILANASSQLELLSRVKSDWPETRVILFTDHGTVDDAVLAMKGGAHDYVEMPIDPQRLARMIKSPTAGAGATSGSMSSCAPGGLPADEFIAVDPKTCTLLAKIDQIADLDRTVLITGESGTGKEQVATRIFARGTRRRARFVPVNCGAVPETLIESEFFGHRRGAFTGAIADRKGLIEEADGGVLFLDEIGEMPAHLQVRLLRFLDNGEVRRVGDSTARRADVRVVAATNRPLEQDAHMGRFRLDLFYRLSVIWLHVPPLRERRKDIPALAQHYVRRGATRLGRTVQGFTPDAMALLENYRWPGNVRELQNVIEGAVILATGDCITIHDLPPAVTSGESPCYSPSEGPGEEELRQLVVALQRSGGNQTYAAAALGISRTTLWRRLRRLGVTA